jgi:hypothetical protein
MVNVKKWWLALVAYQVLRKSVVCYQKLLGDKHTAIMEKFLNAIHFMLLKETCFELFVTQLFRFVLHLSNTQTVRLPLLLVMKWNRERATVIRVVLCTFTQRTHLWSWATSSTPVWSSRLAVAAHLYLFCQSWREEMGLHAILVRTDGCDVSAPRAFMWYLPRLNLNIRRSDLCETS